MGGQTDRQVGALINALLGGDSGGMYIVVDFFAG